MKQYDFENLSVKEILLCAIFNEKTACEDYTFVGETLLRRNETRLSKIFFESAKVEKGHFKRLKKFLFKLYGMKIDDECDIPYAAECGLGFGDDTSAALAVENMTEETAIAFLEKAEQGAEDFYLKASEFTGRLDLKALFRSLGAEEGRHRARIKKIARKAQTRAVPEQKTSRARRVRDPIGGNVSTPV